MHRSDASNPPRVSTLLSTLLAEWPQERIPFGALIDAIDGRGFGALMILISLPCMIPLPIGISGPVFGALLCLLSVQMIAGLRQPWLPARIRRIALPRASLAKFLTRIDPWLMRLEKLCKPRWIWLHGRQGQRISGVLLFATGIALALPIPLTNVPIALVMAGYGIALIERDGRWLLAMWLASLAIVVAFVLLGDRIVGATQLLWQRLT
jgi:hypothetical protein